MKIVALPRDPNPYQGLLYGEMGKLGVEVGYLGQLTPSRSLNLLLLPLETVRARLTGATVVHLHWVFGFRWPGVGRLPLLRGLALAWFRLWLGLIRLLGLRLVWTAHNVLPHARVFPDDAAARRLLVRHCDLVIALSPVTLAALAALAAVPRRSLVVRHGPIGPAVPGALRVPGSGGGPRHFLFFGNVSAYKGVEELADAFTRLPAGTDVRLTIAGHCEDAGLRARLAAVPGIDLRLRRVPDDEVASVLAAADVVVLPFRRVTTSGSAELALAHGRPLIVPDLPGLAGIPGAAAVRYDGSPAALAAALAELAGADGARLAAMAAAALAYSGQASWSQIACETRQAIEDVVAGTPAAPVPPRAAALS